MTTVYLQSSYVEFRELVQRHVRELEAMYFERHSPEWYFLRYLKRLQWRTQVETSARAVAGPMRGLTRYYVDSVVEASDLARRFEDILECHRYALRTERRE